MCAKGDDSQVSQVSDSIQENSETLFILKGRFETTMSNITHVISNKQKDHTECPQQQ